MLPDFKKMRFKRYLVTGPQRSGTTICTHMIAHDTGFWAIDELMFGIDNITQFYKFYNLESVVIQCPGLSYRIQDFNEEETCIIFMIRPLNEIISSEKRINWDGETKELEKYKNFEKNKPISEIKYELWNKTQKEILDNYIEINYSDLSDHPLWVDSNARSKFTKKQYRILPQVKIC